MDLKPLFPSQTDIEYVCRGHISADSLVLSLPVQLQSSIQEDALLDLKYAYLFVNTSSENSQATYKAYRNALERLLLFLWLKQEKTLKEATFKDIVEFLAFSRSPDEPWIGLHARRLCDGLANPEWRPFTIKPKKGHTQADTKLEYTTSGATIQSMVSRLNSFFQYLVIHDFLPKNPMVQLKTKKAHVKCDSVMPVRRLSARQITYCKVEAEKMATEDPEMHERTRFIIFFMLSLYLRISELVPGERHTPKMKDFTRDADGNWWFRVVGGKGSKDRMVPMSDEDLTTLARYRNSRDLTPYPSFYDEEPLVIRNRGTGQLTSDRSIRTIVQNCFDRARYQLMADGFEQDALSLHDASAHSLRLTGISEDLNTHDRPLAHVADDAGHQDLKTTSHYLDVDLRDRHRSKQRNHPNTFK